jgi:hypothetical protein
VPSSRKTTRREFARNLALLAATPLLAPSGVPAADDKPPDPVAATADALLEAARARFGRDFPEDHVKQIRERIHRSLLSGQAMRKPKLQNGDEPAFSFRADLP